MAFLDLERGAVEGRLVFAPDARNALVAFYSNVDGDGVDALVHGGGWRYYPVGTAPTGGFAGLLMLSGHATDGANDYPESYPFIELGYAEVTALPFPGMAGRAGLMWEVAVQYAIENNYVYNAAFKVGAGLAF